MNSTISSTAKVWGRSIRLHLDNFTQLELIEAEPGGYSSIHYHAYKTNLFFVAGGVLEVRTFGMHMSNAVNDVFDAGDAHAQHKILRAGDWYIVRQQMIHQFVAKTLVLAYECYLGDPEHGQIDPEDICRLSEGGLDKVSEAGVGEYPTPRVKSRYCAICNEIMSPDELPAMTLMAMAGAIRDVCHRCRTKQHAE